MDSSNGKACSTERRSSTRQSLRLSVGGIGHDDDEYDLSAMLVSDGFRPTNDAPSTASEGLVQGYGQPLLTGTLPSTTAEPSTQPPLSPITASQSGPSESDPDVISSEPSPALMKNRPSSISKPPRAHDSFSLRNDGNQGTAPGPAQLTRNSSLTDTPVIRAESPYTGPSGPSHPYQMYPQRTMTVASTSTSDGPIVEQQRAYNGPRGPAHPYALYTQNTVPTGPEPTSQPPIPVGFNGLGGSYQRQLGPDGEEAGDLIGPLGHTEELPPYTRYADNTFVPRTQDQPQPQPEPQPQPQAQTQAQTQAQSPTNEPASPMRDISGAGGIGIATRNPEFSSTDDDLALPRTRPSVRSTQSDTSHHDINTAARDVAEKPPMNKWQRRAKKKLCGIVPYWTICLLMVGLILMGIIMGAVIGTMITNHHHGGGNYPEPSIEPTAVHEMPDDLAPVQTGTFSIPSIQTRSQQTSCFKDSSESQAWICQAAPMAYYGIDIEKCPKPVPDTQQYQVKLLALSNVSGRLLLGDQVPAFSHPAQLQLISDTSEGGEPRPAWWFETDYNKTVIVSEEKLIYLNKRGYEDGSAWVPGPSQFGKQSPVAKPGQKVWICTWPGVRFDFYIYPNQNVTNIWGTSTTATQAPTSTAHSGSQSNEDDSGSGSGSSSSSSNSYNLPPQFPVAVKIIERRVYQDPGASCQQVEVLEDGNTKPVMSSKGKPVEIQIAENKDPWDMQNNNKRSLEAMPKGWFAQEIEKRSVDVNLTQCACVLFAS